MAPSTFASAAAGNSNTTSQGPTRDAANDWSRRMNGATQTFRRPSGATNTPSTAQQHDAPAPAPRYVPPHRNGTLPDTRYNKDQLFESFRVQQTLDGGLSDGLSELFVGGFNPDMANGASPGWGRNEHNRDVQPGPDVCWGRDASHEPLGLQEMDDEEREYFTTSVNTPMKPASKENQSNGMPGRKISISNSATAPGAFGPLSPNVSRGGGRRRDTSDSYPFPQNNLSSPAGFNRDDGRAASPPPSLLRRRTDLNKSEDKDGDDKGASGTPFGTLKRHPTGPLSAQFPAPPSPWTSGPQSAGLSPMGSFGNFGLGSNIGQPGTPTDKRPGLGSGRSESRFKNVLHKDGDEGGARTVEKKTSMSNLARVNENESWRPGDRMDPANEHLDETEEDLPTGSAALAADADISPPNQRQGYRGYGTPSRQGAQEDFGFGAFGMTSDNTHAFGQGFHPAREAFHQTPAHQRMGLQPEGANDPMSPTNTNPYQSPEQHGIDRSTEDTGSEGNDLQNSHLPGLGHFNVDPAQQLGGLGGISALPNLGRAHAQGPASDRSQTSSVGPHRAFSGLGGLSGLGSIPNMPGSAGWPVSQGGLGTPSRQTAGLSNAFGGGIFSNQMSDLQSPGLAGLGGAGLMSAPGGSFGGSRMASMFPPQMQEQMQPQNRDGSNERAAQPFGGLGEFGRSTESPFANQGFNDLASKGQHDPNEHPRQQEQPQTAGQNQPPGSSASNLPPAPQQKTMVMPDRMRWIYKDPQGQTQGPWSGLEMHDWYKAGFFSPELLVKKYEDLDYEPLAQLIRRIGNSREPFLVPQIGIPHGQTAPSGPGAWPGLSSGSAQPPFASSFPSFGTTLTADQQNALERRKQEEQYLMARQKEHLAQAQIAQRMQMQSGGHPGMGPGGQLHHHSSAHSLQSQPSFGSITSPAAGYQPSPIQGPASAGQGQQPQGFFDNSFRQPQGSALGAVGAPSLGHIREEEIPSMMDRMDLGTRQQTGQFGAPGQPFLGQQGQQQPQPDAHEGKIQQMLHDRSRLQQEQAEHDARQESNDQQEAQVSAERLQHFQQLQNEALQQAQNQIQEKSAQRDVSATESSIGSPVTSAHAEQSHPQEPLSLTEQVQKAASAKQSPAPQQPGFPLPFPPPAQSQSPLPAPSAQRTGRASVADQLQTDARDASQTPSLDTPSATIAPWAKEPAEAPRGPSLKEIQEAEAKKAAEQEKIALAAKRAQLQAERELEAQAQAVPIQPGIPASATWGAPSPATPTGSGPAAWAKTAPKPTGTTSSKTLAQIQKEEEARKRKQAAAAAALQAQANAMNVVSSPAGGKSYANLAGKVSATPVQASVGSGTWTTVGASGKTKTPASAPAPSASRAASSGVVPIVAAPTARKMPSRSTTLGTPGAVNAQEEFKKWAVNELRPDLKKSFNAEAFVAELLQYPLEMDLLVDAVHQSSETIDTRHFAEEWIRRKRLADKGLVDNSVPKTSSPANVGSGAGGWSEVAKKGPSKEQPKEEANGMFRVVAAKKRGGKR
ncbi:hypothetical protein AC578_369 [Pseudocercospora eumusae]|uniref:GYF domain-containing protein n=1 Tax=Pseudocercospora eumusae TaxID=321146 RepID=A0A139HU42_9PEZI|nr:hypothetical protein AC578_369 [Pseudocercospora eumusae]